ncbi:hypothetical protein QR680_015435 [Steinernema hermaphroditum]|uniref:Uncharacterized protein n=1 Tax=Steinernema hermaphroditum TaxID=289476 RepID=A0AA39H9K8_9BILA|nr:hypothetical protein QR680_015435 [Steinernema hermaphroditum]
MSVFDAECRFEGWLRVYEGHVPQHPHPSDSEFRPDVRWHYGFCVARTDDQSLICYRSEQSVPNDRTIPRIRLDGGSFNLWKDLNFASEFVRRRPFHLRNFSSNNTVLIEEDETEEEPARFSYATLRTPRVDHRPLARKSRSRSLMQRFTRRISSNFPRYKSQEDLDSSASSAASCDHSDKVAQGYMVRVSSQGGHRLNRAQLSRFSRSCDHLEDVSHDEGTTSSSSGYRTGNENHVRFRKSGAVEKRLKKTANFLFGSGWNLASSSSNSA